MAKTPATPARVPVQQEQSYPLISMVQLVTFCVALVTCVDFKKFSNLLKTADLQNVFSVAFTAGTLGFLIGSSIGLGQIRKWRSMFLGGAAGAIVSTLIAATYAAPARPAQAFAACLLPLVTTLFLRSRTP